MQRHRIAATLVATAVLAAPAVAGAHINHINHINHSILRAGAAATYGHDVGRQHVKTHKHVKAHKAQTAPTTTPTQNPTPVPDPAPPSYGQPTNTGVQYVEADDQACTPQNVVAFLQAHQATVLRMVLTPVHAAAQDGLACVQAARAAGYKIYLTLAYDSASSPAQVAAYVTSTLAVYGPAWAVALGNEQTLSNAWLNEVSSTPAMYYQMWQAVEPTIAGDEPGAIRVLADASPWDVNWLEQLVKLHPTGAMAAAVHCYDSYFNGLQDVPELAATIASDGLPLWCSEMAPAANASPDSPAATAFVTQTPGQFAKKVSQVLAASEDVQLRSWYEWPEIGAITS